MWKCGTVRPRRPVVRRSNPGGIGGHGLTIVESLARCWGVERYEDYKVVWFEAPVSPRVRIAPPPTGSPGCRTPRSVGR